MTAFHTIAIPHDDILQGHLTMDVFAAALWEVFKGRGVDELQSKYERMEVSIHLDKGQMADQEYKDKVKEAFRQMGIDID